MHGSFALSLVLFVTSFSALAEKSSFEERMHKIYTQSYSEEISDKDWAEYTENLGTRTYVVTEGDTLWGLSLIFFGDGHYWSKIWSFNSNLTNPHLISVGQEIRLFTGSLEAPPSLIVGGNGTITHDGGKFTLVQEGTDGQAPVIKGVVTSNDTTSFYGGGMKIPDPRSRVRPVMTELPSSLSSTTSFDAAKYGDKGISMDVRPPVRTNPLFVAHTFLFSGRAENYPRIGEVIEPENDNRIVGVNQQLYVKSDETFQVGERLTLMGQEYVFDRNGFRGDVISYKGILEITDIMPEKTYRGYVRSSLDPLGPGSWVTREAIPAFPDDLQGRPSNKVVQIIGGGSSAASKVFGQGDILFLRGGARDDIRVGDIMGVYKKRLVRYREPEVSKSPVPIGHIKVYRSEPTVATAYVVSSTDVIYPGDETGAPTKMEGFASESEKGDLNELETGLDFSDASGVEPEPEAESTLDEDLEEFEVQ